MTCPASGTRQWFAGRPSWPAGATNDQILNWAYEELYCDVCSAWVPAAER